jgi:putative MATE family efflux protein
MDDKRIELLSKAKIPTAVMKLAVPAIIGMLVMSIYNVVDTMFVAWLGTEATGATQVVYPVMMLITAIGLSYGIGAASFISRLLGQKKKERAESVLITTVISSLVTGILFALTINVFLEPVLTLFGATPEIMNMAKSYGFIIVLGAPFQILNMTFNNILRSEGSAIESMIGMAAGAILNIILDPILIFGFDLGIEGAAIATTFSQFVTTVILVSHYFKKKTVLHLNVKSISFDKEIVQEVIKMGSPTFFRQLLVSISMGLMNVAASTYGGPTGIAAMGIVLRTMMMIQFVIFGLSQGFQVVAGFNYGAKSYDRLKESIRFTFIVSFTFSTVTSLLFVFFDNQIIGIFKPTNEVLELALPFMKAFALTNILVSISNVIGVYYQATGKGLPALILSVARQGIFLIPIILILPNMIGITGVMVAQPLADILTLIVSLFMFIPVFNQINSKEKREVNFSS